MNSLSRLSPATQGIILMICAMIALASMDTTVKYLAARYEVMQLVWVRYTGQTLITLAFLLPRLRATLKTRFLHIQLFRSLILFGATICFFFSFSRIGLAEATAILQTSPLLITVAAYFFLGEGLGWRRIVGAAVGLVGALIIIRPGTDVFSPYALLALAAALGYTGYAVTTRFLSRVESIWTSCAYTSLLGCLFATAIVPFFWTPPALSDLPLMVLVGILAAIGQYLLIRSFFVAEAGTVAPFGYASLIFAAVYGMVLFDEFPDFWDYAGALVISASGIYVLHREMKRTEVTRG